jgi:hypothetical protein
MGGAEGPPASLEEAKPKKAGEAKKTGFAGGGATAPPRGCTPYREWLGSLFLFDSPPHGVRPLLSPIGYRPQLEAIPLCSNSKWMY